jgi:hypothetical protein
MAPGRERPRNLVNLAGVGGNERPLNSRSKRPETIASRSRLPGARYRPEGARLGDADAVLFWFRPAQSTRSRVLYADLY